MTAAAGVVAGRLAQVRASLARACRMANRSPRDVLVVAVSKRVGPDAIVEAVQAGARDFGESYLQQALPKMEAVGRLLAERGGPVPELRWHFVGRLQSNKAARVARRFAWIHSLDSASAARAVSRAASEGPADGRESVHVLLQVKLGGGAARGGVPPDDCAAFARAATELPGISLAGVMGVADPGRPAAPQFARLRTVLEELRALNLPDAPLAEISAGMSQDFTDAIAQGATIVRLGEAVFGR